MAIQLSDKNLNLLPEHVDRPRYNRKSLTAGIVHIGVGNFHRAHLGVYLDRLFQSNRSMDWAIIGAGVRDGDRRMRQALSEQDWLSTIIEADQGAERAFVTGPMIDFVEVEPAKLIAAVCEPAIRIVSMTITEGGYYVDATTGKFDEEHPEIAQDVAALGNASGMPQSVFGILVSAIKRRRELGHGPLTIMSCDNLPGNGNATRAAVLGLANQHDRSLGAWIDEHTGFPNSMVDCITPGTTDLERESVRNEYGIIDNWPVMCEPFRQWVLEDRFVAGRPTLEDVDVQFVDDVIPFELMKLRILNGGHAAISYPAALLDIHYVHDAINHKLIRGYLDRLVTEEIIPAVPPVPNTDLFDYFRIITSRFANHRVKDTIPRLCQDGSNRQPKFILQTARDRLAKNQGVRGLALESALWCRYCAGTSDSNKPIAVEDVAVAELQAAARASRENPAAFLNIKSVYGDLAQNDTFASSFSAALTELYRDGVAATLERYIAAA